MSDTTQKRLEIKRHIRGEHKANISAIREREQILFGRPISSDFLGEDEISSYDNAEMGVGNTFKLRMFAAASAFMMYALFSISGMGDNNSGIKIGSMPASDFITTIDNELEKDFNIEGITIIHDIENVFGKN